MLTESRIRQKKERIIRHRDTIVADRQKKASDGKVVSRDVSIDGYNTHHS